MQCVICLDELGSGVDAIVTLGCHHSFHRACILESRNDCCPLCRKVLRSSASGGALAPQDICLMRKRKREDAEDADRAAAEEALSGDYIGPGTQRYRMGYGALIAAFGSSERICAMGERHFCKRAHRLLHKQGGALWRKGVTCQAVRHFVVSVWRLTCEVAVAKEEAKALSPQLVDWMAERLPGLPPAVVHEMAHEGGSCESVGNIAQCARIDAHIRAAWRALAVVEDEDNIRATV